MKKIMFLLAFAFACSVPSRAGANLERPALFLSFAEIQPKALDAMMVVQNYEAKNHHDISKRVDDIAKLQQKLYVSLTKYQNTLQMIACTYAIYYEFSQTIKAAGDLAESVSICPTGVFASLVQDEKSRIWNDALMTISTVTNDAYSLIKRPMTAKERCDQLDNIRVEIAALNEQLRTISNMVRYTSLIDVWEMAVMRHRIKVAEDRGVVAIRSMQMAALRVQAQIFRRKYLSFHRIDGFGYTAK